MSTDDLPAYDHRRLGREQGLFHIQDEAAGSVFWHPNGHTLFRTIEAYIRERLDEGGYREIKTPQLLAQRLWDESGHWDKFRSNMFVCVEGGDIGKNGVFDDIDDMFLLKPMNCPGHVQVFNANTVSYRDLPMRLAEFGCCHRSEPSGALHGIMRVRQFTQDDAHIFCTPEQVAAETQTFCALLMRVYADFGFTEVKIGLSTRPALRAGDDQTWDRAEAALQDAVTAAGLAYTIQPGEGAFYGPKLEFALTDLRGREWQCGTLQLDFVLPERLDAAYTDHTGARVRPVMLHRAILGSLERFVGILLEHYEGRLPTWLCPEQFVIVTVRPECRAYAERLHRSLAIGAGLRGRVDARDENLSQMVKEHSEAGVPFVIVVGPRDEAGETAAVRRLGSTRPEVVPASDLAARLTETCWRPDDPRRTL